MTAPSGRRVAFLRGLNVGGHRVTMDTLRERFRALGYTDVATFIASGNVVFGGGGAAEAEEVRIEDDLEATLGYAVPTFLRTLDEVAALLDGAPVGPEDLEGPDHAHYVLLLKQAPPPPVHALFTDLDSDRDSFRIRGREVHWLSRGKISESPLFAGGFERATRDVLHTMRNANTLRRLVAKFS